MKIPDLQKFAQNIEQRFTKFYFKMLKYKLSEMQKTTKHRSTKLEKLTEDDKRTINITTQFVKNK